MRPSVTTTLSPATVRVSVVASASAVPSGNCSTTCDPFNGYGERLSMSTVYVIRPSLSAMSEAERWTRTRSSTSGLTIVNLSSRADGPSAGGVTTAPVAGSTSVSGMGSGSGVPWTSVPNGAGFDGVAEDVASNGSVI